MVLNNDNFDQEIAEGTVLVDFWGEGCGPCRAMEPILSEIEIAGVRVVKLKVQDAMDVAVRYNISAVPTFIVFKDGKEVKRLTGIQSKDTLLEASQ